MLVFLETISLQMLHRVTRLDCLSLKYNVKEIIPLVKNNRQNLSIL